jgi:hypothetical protein
MSRVERVLSLERILNFVIVEALMNESCSRYVLLILVLLLKFFGIGQRS